MFTNSHRVDGKEFNCVRACVCMCTHMDIQIVVEGGIHGEGRAAAFRCASNGVWQRSCWCCRVMCLPGTIETFQGGREVDSSVLSSSIGQLCVCVCMCVCILFGNYGIGEVVGRGKNTESQLVSSAWLHSFPACLF